MAKEGYPETGDNSAAAKTRRETYWRGITERWKASGLPKSTFCAREGISDASLHWWLGELGRRDGRPGRRRGLKKAKAPRPAPRGGFLPVRIMPTRPAKQEPIEVVVCGQVIRVVPDFDPETFLRLVAVLQGEPLAREVTTEGGRC